MTLSVTSLQNKEFSGTSNTKRALIGNQSLTEKQLVTVLTEVEAVINSCPLVYVNADINSSMILTPSDFLLFCSQHIIPKMIDEMDPELTSQKGDLFTTAIGDMEMWAETVEPILELVEE